MIIAYCVGRMDRYDGPKSDWELVGVYMVEEEAVAACRDERYFVGPIPLNRSVESTNEWAGSYYPKA